MLSEQFRFSHAAIFDSAISGNPTKLDPVSYLDIYAVAKEAITMQGFIAEPQT